MFDRTVTISSSGKTFSFTGWKIGWATGPADLVSAVEGAKNWLSYSSGAPFQPAIAHALDHETAFHEKLRDDLARRRDFLCDGLDSLGLEVHVPQGTYFVTTDVSSLGHADGIAFCAAMAERAKVVAIPTQVFYEDGSEHGRHLIRWAFCKEQDLIVEGLRRLRATDLQTALNPVTRPAACLRAAAAGPGRQVGGRPRAGGRGGAAAGPAWGPAGIGPDGPGGPCQVSEVLLEPGARVGEEQPDDRQRGCQLVQDADGEGEQPDHERRGGAGREQPARPVVPPPGEPREHAGTDAPSRGTAGRRSRAPAPGGRARRLARFHSGESTT